MDAPQYSRLREALGGVADPRNAKGQRYEWEVLLTVVCMALASGAKSMRAIAQWVKEHAQELLEVLQPRRQHLPSASTLYRVVRSVSVCELESQLAFFAQTVERTSQHKAASHGQLIGHAIDGKEVRGVREYEHTDALCALLAWCATRVG